MKLYLASALDETLHLILDKLPQNGKVIFIANAADPYPGDKWWIEGDRKVLKDNGFQLTELDLREIDLSEFTKNLAEANIIHFGGGSVLYLLNLLRARGLDNVLKEYVSQGKIIYTGTSAGSIIVAPSVMLLKYDKDEKDIIAQTTDFSGLGLVNFVVIPHCNQVEFIQSNLSALSHLPEEKNPLIMLRDSQLVAFEDGRVEILTSEV